MTGVFYAYFSSLNIKFSKPYTTSSVCLSHQGQVSQIFLLFDSLPAASKGAFQSFIVFRAPSVQERGQGEVLPIHSLKS